LFTALITHHYRCAGSAWGEQLVGEALSSCVDQYCSSAARVALLSRKQCDGVSISGGDSGGEHGEGSLPSGIQLAHAHHSANGACMAGASLRAGVSGFEGISAAGVAGSEARGLVLLVGCAPALTDVGVHVGRCFTHQLHVAAPSRQEHLEVLKDALLPPPTSSATQLQTRQPLLQTQPEQQQQQTGRISLQAQLQPEQQSQLSKPLHCSPQGQETALKQSKQPQHGSSTAAHHGLSAEIAAGQMAGLPPDLEAAAGQMQGLPPDLEAAAGQMSGLLPSDAQAVIRDALFAAASRHFSHSALVHAVSAVNDAWELLGCAPKPTRDTLTRVHCADNNPTVTAARGTLLGPPASSDSARTCITTATQLDLGDGKVCDEEKVVAGSGASGVGGVGEGLAGLLASVALHEDAVPSQMDVEAALARARKRTATEVGAPQVGVGVDPNVECL
jgi:hypothetical protein